MAGDSVGNSGQITGLPTAIVVRDNRHLFNTQTGAQYLYSNGIKHHIPNPDTAYALGTDLSTCTLNMTTAELDAISTGDDVPSFQNGDRFLNSSNGWLYVLARGVYHVPNPTTRNKLGFNGWTTVNNQMGGSMADYCVRGTVPDVSNSNFIKGSTPAQYYVDGQKHYIPTQAIRRCLGGAPYVLFPDNLMNVISTGANATCP